MPTDVLTSPASMGPQISIEGVTKRFGRVIALNNISLHIPPGVFGLLGPNGAGKTTLMRILAGVSSADAGVIRCDGEDVTRKPVVLRSILGYLPQESGFYEQFRVHEFLMYCASLKELGQTRHRVQAVEAALATVNAAAFADRRIATLSAGMKRRVGLAQALLGEPRLIIVDEPTADLDPLERENIRQVLAGLATQRTILLSTHLLADVTALCSQMAVLIGGTLAVLTSPGRAIRSLEGTIFECEIDSAALPSFNQRYEIISSVKLSDRRLRLRFAATDDVLPTEAHQVAATLDDAYLMLLRQVRRA